MKIEKKILPSGGYIIEISYAGVTIRDYGIYSEMGVKQRASEIHRMIMAFSEDVSSNSRRK
jgi:hypothetical protein